jgi:serine/threonine-protein kinase PknG
MTAATCTQPGCGGTIQDGYCDVCGLAPAPLAAAPASGVASGPGGGWAPLPSAASIRYAGSASARAASGGSGPAATVRAAQGRAAPGPRA